MLGARDFAKIKEEELYLNKGNWEETIGTKTGLECKAK
jgi:hypothetical protein